MAVKRRLRLTESRRARPLQPWSVTTFRTLTQCQHSRSRMRSPMRSSTPAREASGVLLRNDEVGRQGLEP